MAVVRDVELDETFEAFMAVRHKRTHDAADALRRRRQEANEAIERTRAHYQKQFDDAMKDDTLDFATRALLQVEMRRRMAEELARLRIDRGVAYSTASEEVRPRRTTLADRRDFAHARVAQMAERVDLPGAPLDPLLAQVPGLRRSRIDGGFSYRERCGFQETELCRVAGGEVFVRNRSDKALEVALIAAQEHCEPPLSFSGSPDFVRRASAIAARLGLDTETPPPADRIRGRGAPFSDGPTPGASPDSPPPSSAKSPKEVDLVDYATVVSDLSARYNDEPVHLLSSKAGFTVEGNVVHIEPVTDEATSGGVLMQILFLELNDQITAIVTSLSSDECKDLIAERLDEACPRAKAVPGENGWTVSRVTIPPPAQDETLAREERLDRSRSL